MGLVQPKDWAGAYPTPAQNEMEAHSVDKEVDAMRHHRIEHMETIATNMTQPI